MHIEDLAALIQDDVFVPVRIDAAGGVDILLKIEGLNPAGSIKFKTALAMIADMERSGRLKPGATVVESSSGNLGLALSIVCRALGYGFVCVSDPNISPATRDMIEATGGRMEPVTETDENGGYLGTRLRRIAALLDALAPRLVIAADPAVVPPGVAALILDHAAIPPAETPFDAVAVDGRDPIYGFYTSGTTGLPKCAINLHGGLLNRFGVMTRRFAADGRADEVRCNCFHHAARYITARTAQHALG